MKMIKQLVAVAILASVLPAQAAVEQYSFSGIMNSGHYNGESFTGSFSFDNASLISSGTENINVSNLAFNFLNTSFSQVQFDGDAPSATFEDGVFSGLSWNYNSTNPDVQFSFVSGFTDASDAYVAFDTGLGTSGSGDVIYAPVPEADTYAMLLAGLGILGFVSRRRQAN